MPNWTYNVLKCEGITKMDIFTEQNGENEFDFNKVIPRPECFEKTVSPVSPMALLAHFASNEKAPIEALCHKVNALMEQKKRNTGSLFANVISADEIESLKTMSEKELSAYLNKDISLTPNEKISAVELGRNYATAFKETGCFDWYDWSVKYWGVKWNASGTEIEENEIHFYTPWTVPMPLLVELSKQHPDVEFSLTSFFEGELIDSYSCNIKNGEIYNEETTASAYEELEDEEDETE